MSTRKGGDFVNGYFLRRRAEGSEIAGFVLDFRPEGRISCAMETNPIVEVVLRIPKGKVATYGQIARAAGYPNGARVVVWTLNSQSRKHGLPWHRVVNAKGTISLAPGDGYELQKSMLVAEGVEFDTRDRIDLKRFGWDFSEAL
jgi:methylated-DNA-protein-cysteine methyltransferase related protein